MRFCDFCLLSRGSLATEGPAEISFDYRVANADQEDHVSELYRVFRGRSEAAKPFLSPMPPATNRREGFLRPEKQVVPDRVLACIDHKFGNVDCESI